MITASTWELWRRLNHMNSLIFFTITLWLTEGARPNRDSGKRFLALTQYVNL